MKLVNSLSFNPKTKLEEKLASIKLNMDKLFTFAHGNIRFGTGVDGDRGENIAGTFQTFTTDATPDTEGDVAHGLGSVPVGYLVIKQDKAGNLYAGSTAWTATNVYLKSDVASVAFTAFILK